MQSERLEVRKDVSFDFDFCLVSYRNANHNNCKFGMTSQIRYSSQNSPARPGRPARQVYSMHAATVHSNPDQMKVEGRCRALLVEL